MVHLSSDQEFSLLKLYQNDIIKRLTSLYLSRENAKYLEELLPVNKIDELATSCESEAEFGSKLWDCLRNSSMNHALYSTILNYLHQVDPDLHNFLSALNENDRRSHFTKVLSELDDFMKYTHVDTVIEYLKQIPQYADPIKKLEEQIKEIDNQNERKRILLRTVPLFGSGAIYDVLKGVHLCGEDAQKFVERLVPKFLRYYDVISADRKRPFGLVQYCNVDTSVEEFLETVDATADLRVSPYAVDLKWENLSSQHSSSTSVSNRIVCSIDNNMYNENPIVLRDYQKELCSVALSWKNTIICAPTGSGKTIVAAHIIKTFLMNPSSHGRNPKVLFMIPNTFILEQQADTMRKFLMHKFKVLSTSGANNIALRPAIEANDVVVTTPQMIVNLLGDFDSGDMERPTTPFRLTTFGMIFFDETHATKKENPYNKVMQQYHRDKFSGKLLPNEKLPLVVGLTASLGVGDAKNDCGALQHITEICANLDCKQLSMVREFRHELEMFSPITPDQLRYCPDQSDLRQSFRSLITKFMERIEKSIIKLFSGEHIELPSSNGLYGEQYSSSGYQQQSLLTKPPNDKELQSYGNWLFNAKRKQIPENVNISDVTKTRINKKMDVLEVLYNGFLLLSNFSSRRAFTEIAASLDVAQTDNTMDAETQIIWKDYRDHLERYTSDDSAILSELVGQLCLQHAEKPDFRAIVFVQTREFCKILADLLRTDLALIKRSINTEYITGLTAKLEEGNSKTKQEDKLKRFSSGETRCLIATSVAEEGLDIAKCNLVIKYNYATNEIAHVQRRGRGRAENSRCILLASSEKLMQQEEKNMQKEKLMDQALNHIYRGYYPLEDKVNVEINQLWLDIQKTDAERALKEEKMATNGIVYSLLCKTCSVTLCSSNDIKVYNKSQYCVSDPNFWQKIRFKKSTEAEQKKSKFNSLYKIFCSGRQEDSICGNCIGRVVKVNNGQMPVLSAADIKLEWTTGGYRQYKAPRQWKEICRDFFAPTKLRTHDVITMHKAAGAPEYSEPIYNIDGSFTF